MSPVLRAAWTFVVFFAAYVGTWLFMLVVPLAGFDWIGNLVALAVAIWAARCAWLYVGERPTSFAATIGYGAMLCGGIGFAAGFFGPMIFAPEANQGPLLGIFITGPAGVLIGAVAGFVYAVVRARGGDRGG